MPIDKKDIPVTDRAVTMEKIIALCKNRGYIFPGSEIYGGLANTWDFGPLGVEFKNNIKDAWRQKFVRESGLNVGLDAAILMNPQTWVASGHVGGFSDPLIDCRSCKTRYRADQLIEDWYKENEPDTEVVVDGWSREEMENFISEKAVKCPNCGKSDFTGIRQFNLMFKTFQGVTEDSKSEIYMRPETAQGIFVNFKNVQRTARKKIPFGIAQVGKSFRNEITPGNFIFRVREFEQMELEFFCKPGTELEWFDYWKSFCLNFLKSLGLKPEYTRYRDHSPEELSHYSNATTDIEYLFPFGWGEIWGVASRTDYDLMAHQTHSGEDMSYLDPETNERYVPYCIEPSVGVERLVLAYLVDAYDEEVLTDAKGKEDVRTVLRLHPALAPYKAAVLPLSKKLEDVARPVYEELRKYFMVEYDAAGSIGKRYRREDEIGTPFCICVDFDTAEDGAVTIRDRDTMEQVRVPVSEVRSYIEERLRF
ncbi:MAG: glycine--tRNA ligase [Mogibacterium sp.]|nr:glycine--tRNA ligase [Mogibacterium sp.]